MKKLVAWAIVLIMVCFAMCGCGSKSKDDGLEIHAGVKFLDTHEEVKKKETLELIVEENDWQEEGFKSGLLYEGKIAEIDKAKILYKFDDANKLIYACYTFYKKQLKENSYDNLYKALSEKYGDEVSENEYAYDNVGHPISKWKEVMKAWIYRGKQYNVKIEILKTRASDIEIYYFLYRVDDNTIQKDI